MNNQAQNKPNMPHTLIMEDRAKLSLSGVIKVETFDDSFIALKTVMGGLTVKGVQLHIAKMDVDTGDLKITGNVQGLVYSDSGSKSLLSKLLK